MEVSINSSGHNSIEKIGLGLANFGFLPFSPKGVLAGRAVMRGNKQETSNNLLDFAWDSGIRFFDSSSAYGNSEKLLAAWKSENKKPVNVISKWGYIPSFAGEKIWSAKRHTLSVLNAQFRESYNLLGESLVGYLVHSADLKSGVFEDKDVLKRMMEIKSSGISIGVTVSGPNQCQTIQRAVDIQIQGEKLFNIYEATWNLLEQSAEPALKEANDMGAFIIIKEVLANGRLTESQNRFSRFINPKDIIHLSHKKRVTLDAVAVVAALTRPWCNLALLGTTNINHLKSNLSAIEHPFPKEEEWDFSRYRQDSSQYWKLRNNGPKTQ